MTHVTQSEFARLMGVNRSTVTRWIQNGRLSAEASGLIDPETGRRQVTETESPLPHHRARKAQFEQAREGQGMDAAETPPVVPENAPVGDQVAAALRLETWKLQKAKAELANMEVDQKAGLLVERAEVDYVLADFGNTLRALLEGLPDRLAPAISAHRGDVNAIHVELETVAAELLRDISEHMKRRMEALA